MTEGAFLAFIGVGYVANAETISARIPRVDIADVSKHNRQMPLPEFTYMRNNYRLKSVTTKISEVVGFHD